MFSTIDFCGIIIIIMSRMPLFWHQHVCVCVCVCTQCTCFQWSDSRNVRRLLGICTYDQVEGVLLHFVVVGICTRTESIPSKPKWFGRHSVASIARTLPFLRAISVFSGIAVCLAEYHSINFQRQPFNWINQFHSLFSHKFNFRFVNCVKCVKCVRIAFKLLYTL